jgi:hypothetical protein
LRPSGVLPVALVPSGTVGADAVIGELGVPYRSLLGLSDLGLG